MKKVLDNYSSKNDVNIKQIVAYKDNILEIEEYRDGFKKDHGKVWFLDPTGMPTAGWGLSLSAYGF